uniref:Uncharacterized protein n=1 Tax=Glycine max TaxID=3847 RepID=C6TGR2_SOYBN|nr:unknown [Glycine max]
MYFSTSQKMHIAQSSPSPEVFNAPIGTIGLVNKKTGLN